jgi:phosphatidylserine/phosphatidylglycerophosphate/cardiolipin synthase-like enzyme
VNWNGNSPAFNREAGVILDSPALGAYYSSVFDDDWNRAGAGSGMQGPDLVRLTVAGFVILMLLIFFWNRRR